MPDTAAAIAYRHTSHVPPLPDVRAAILHDWFQGFHGAERVVEMIRTGVLGEGPTPDVMTFHAAHELLPAGLSASIVRESCLASLPLVRQRGHRPGRWRYLLPYMPHYFRHLDLRPYELVIASSHACAIHARPRSDAMYVCYCHTPMRYAWGLEGEDQRLTGARQRGLRLLGGYLRRLDREASQRPDGYVANSQAVRERIARFYGREATVIHPPVDVDDFHPHAPKDPDHFLWVHRLVGYKRPELVAEAFRGLPYRLTMVGVGPLEGRLRATLPPNVELRGWVSRVELARLYGSSSGFLHLAEEDFGISMVEALAAGTPVLALNRGGARDIVRDGVDGVLLDRPGIDTVRSAVHGVATARWDRGALAARAAEFSSQRFVERFRAYLAELGEGRGAPG